jgi:archaellum biogenesis ATPase FlaH
MYELEGAEGAVAPGSNLLVEGPALSGKRSFGLRAIERGVEGGAAAAVVTTTVSAERILPESLAGADGVGVVDCVTEHFGGTTSNADTVRYASSPEDLTGLGIRFSELVEALLTQRDELWVLLDSLTPLLVYSGQKTVFRFLHVFTSRIETTGGVGLFTIDTPAHDEEELAVLRRLFDGRIGIDVDGNVDVSDLNAPAP